MKKVSEKSNKNVAYSEQEMKRYLGALNEQNNETLKTIKEGFYIVNRRLDGHDKKFDSIDKKLNLHTEMIGNIMEDVSILKDDMQIVKKELKKKVDYDEFLSLVQRVIKIEAKI
ncbi:MAG: hypothetical protein WCG45_01525 [bacterium]